MIFNFNRPYINWLNKKFSCNIPPDTNEFPNTWNYATDGNYVAKQQDKEFWNWAAGDGNYTFWSQLQAYPGAKEFLNKANGHFDEVHFVTSRPGQDVHRATVDALESLGVKNPSVIISNYKVPQLIELNATDFLDDRDKNFEDILDHNQQAAYSYDNRGPIVTAKLFMLDRPWNRHYNHVSVERISSVNEIFHGKD